MPTMIATHGVKDTALWLASPARAEAMATIGVTGIRTFVDPQDPTKVGLMAEVPDVDALMEAMQGPEFAKAMEADGVIPPVNIYLES